MTRWFVDPKNLFWLLPIAYGLFFAKMGWLTLGLFLLVLSTVYSHAKKIVLEGYSYYGKRTVE